MIADIVIGNEFRDSIHKYSDEQLDSLTTPVEIPWEPTAATIAKISKHPSVKFILCVRNLREMAQAAERLSRSMKFDIVTLETGRLALFMKGERKWRDISRSLGPVACQGLILRLAAKAIEKGNRIHGILLPVEDIIIYGARPADAEVMFQSWRLK